MQAYSPLKSAWHIDAIAAMREGRAFVPPYMQLVISDLCNQNCNFCAYRMDGGSSSELFAENGNSNPNRKIETAKVLEILDDAARLGVKAVLFSGGGEPTVHPDHIEIFRHAQELGLKSALVTNAVRVEDLEPYAKMDFIRISVDAATAGTYRETRQSTKFDTAIANLERICAMPRRGVVGAGFVVTPWNWWEVADFCALAKDKGADYVRISAMFSDAGPEPFVGIFDAIREQLAIAGELVDRDFQIADLFGERIEDLELGRPDYEFCGYQQFVVHIGGNLNIHRCCTTSYTTNGTVGTLKDKSFAQWFASEERMERYVNFDAHSCRYCRFNDKNRVINYMLDPEPVHVDFV